MPNVLLSLCATLTTLTLDDLFHPDSCQCHPHQFSDFFDIDQPRKFSHLNTTGQRNSITLNCTGNYKRHNHCNNCKLIKHVANHEYRAIEVEISDLDRRSVRNIVRKKGVLARGQNTIWAKVLVRKKGVQGPWASGQRS